MAYTLSIPISLGAASSGHTLSGQLVDTDGTPVGDTVSDGFVELGGGAYLLTLSIPAGFRGALTITDSDTVVAATAINPEHGEYLDAAISSRLSSLGEGDVTVVAPPVMDDGTVITLIRGDAYLASDSRALTWSDPEGTWPDLSGATLTLQLNNGVGHQPSFVATLLNATTIQVEINRTASSTLRTGAAVYRFALVAAWGLTRQQTLVRGTVTVLASN